jgi:chloride channel 7
MSPKSVMLWQVYNLFRQLGLRHIFVVPRPSRVLGMITRKDLLLEVPDSLITDDCWM